MSTTKILIEIGLPTPEAQEKSKKNAQPHKDIEGCIRDALELIESGHESQTEWLMINKVYKSLRSIKKPTKRAKNIMKLIEPVMRKYGHFEKEAN